MAPSDANGEGQPASDSYATFWDAIPIDSDETPNSSRPDIMSFDPYADFVALTEEGAPSWLTVEQTDVG